HFLQGEGVGRVTLPGLGIPVYAVRRPEMPEGFVTVTGENGLRRAIEQLLPGFFPLRTGFTTGACATAAAKAALLTLLGREVGESLPITFPNGEELALPIAKSERGRCGAAGSSRQCVCAPGGKGSAARGTLERSSVSESAYAVVIKDAGDDPDVTNGREIVVNVALSDEPRIHFLQGEGVGRVTLPGLDIPVGEPAVNKVPREMITRELSALYDGGLDVTISVPGGRELALKTFNPKLGVVDGISIIGTSGIVRPFSSEAFVEALRKEMEVAIAVGVPQIVINSGAKSEQFLRARFPDLQPQGFIHYGNFIGATLSLAAELGIRQVTMGIMLGKAVKLAEGNLDTHSKNVVMNREFLKEVAEGAGCSPAAAAEIERLTLARELWNALQPADAQRFFSAILARCRTACETVYPASAGKLDILLLDEEGNVF
ncbi:MAG: cobalamin biosynthesis protein CbiD, partial [Bacteroidales bacterium]|nr:cobalamin biosynthesis protein CbiD [Bacteroidales bacterium]